MRRTPSGVCFRSTRLLPCLLLLGLLLPPAEAPAQVQGKDQQKCIVEVNKSFAKVAKKQGKAICKCIKDGSKAKLVGQTIEACIASDPGGKVAAAQDKARIKIGAKCMTLPDFGGADPNTANRVAVAKELSLIHAIFGSDLDEVIVVLDKVSDKDPNDPTNTKAEGKCQVVVAKLAKKCQDTKLKTFNSCKKNGLKGKLDALKVPDPDRSPFEGSADLEDCLGFDPKGKIAKACVTKMDDKIVKKCSGVDLSVTFPPLDPNATLGDLADFVDARVECQVCLAINAVDGTVVDCDRFDDGLLNGSCPDLLEVLSPAPGESAEGGSAFLYFLLGEGADPDSLEIVLDSPNGPAALLPTQVSATQGWAEVDCPMDGAHTLHVSVLNFAGTQRHAERIPIACGLSGFALGAEVEVRLEADHIPEVLRVVPLRPLRNGATYALVVTGELRSGGQPMVASADFQAAAGVAGPPPAGVEALWSADPNDPNNPFPSDRLLEPNGHIRIPDGFSARAVPDIARLAGVRSFLRALDPLVAEHHGFSPSTTIVLSFAGPVDLGSATPQAVFLVEIANPGPPGSGLGDLITALQAQRGIAPEDVAVATLFTTEDLAGEMARIQLQIAARAVTTPPLADFSDPDPNDATVFGIFEPNDPEFEGFFGGSPPAGAGLVARGSFLSPEYRELGRFPDRFLDGSEVPPHVSLDFRLVLPAGPEPVGGYPTVILQHGFGGSNGFVTSTAEDFVDAGLAVIGISAPEHGLRGNFFDFFDFTDFNSFGSNFRQGSVDLMQLVQLIQAGIDVDADPNADLSGGGIGYLGVSLGGVLGAVFTAIDPGLEVAVLNVPGGRLAQFAGSVSSLASAFLTTFATAAGIDAKTCDGDPLGTGCTTSAECAPSETCEFNEDFVLLLEAALPSFQAMFDPGDGISYVRQLRIAPPGAAPKPVLVQEGIGDVVVANELTEALANGIGLPANRPDSGALGIAGLWRYPPPDGHGIFGLPAVRAQAVTFLASGGTVLPSP